jgi:hypothetical protein
MSNLKVNTINDASGGSAAVLYGVASPPNSMGFRNRIINGDMRIDQRNAGAAVTVNAGGNVYTLDRWSFIRSTTGSYAVQQSATAPSGFAASLSVTNNTANTPAAGDYNFFLQAIEGFNVSDLGWGTASAQAITLSFQVRASATGTYGGCLRNAAGDRSYPFTFTVAAANTFEVKAITIPGDTTGTWLTTNGKGIEVDFDLGSGATFRGTAGAWASGNFVGATGASQNMTLTSGATFYITGVQLEAGTVATPFERRDYGRELMMCQRYYTRFTPSIAFQVYGVGCVDITNESATGAIPLPVVMRASPICSGVTTAIQVAGSVIAQSAPTFAGSSSYIIQYNPNSVTGTAGQAFRILSNNSLTGYIDASAEL